jgi:protein subunit release factor A
MKEKLYSLTKKDFRIEYFRSSKPGGQHVNKTSTACRITHPASNAVGECQEYKSRLQNQKTAFKRLLKTNKFKIWHNRICHELLTNKSIDDIINDSVNEDNLKIEIKENGKWKKIM